MLSPKVQGLRVLDQLLPDGAVELMVLFSSTSTATRGAGQVDYVAANAWLNAFAQARQGGQTRVVAVNWGIWSDVGMAAAALGAGASDVLPARALDAPILRDVAGDASGETVLTAPLRAADWLLDQHRTKDGQAVMPGTGYIEALAEAAQAQGMSGGFDIRDLYFLRAMPVAEDESRSLRITLQRDGAGFAAEMRSDCVLNGAAGWQLHAQAQIAPLTETRPAAVDLAAIAARCGLVPMKAWQSCGCPKPCWGIWTRAMCCIRV